MAQKSAPRLVYKNGKCYENGRYLSKKDYIYHSSSSDGNIIISCRTGQKYKKDRCIYI